MAREVIETKYQMDGRTYIMRMYEKIIPEDPALNWAKHQAATYKIGSAPSNREYPEHVKMSLVRLNLEI